MTPKRLASVILGLSLWPLSVFAQTNQISGATGRIEIAGQAKPLENIASAATQSSLENSQPRPRRVAAAGTLHGSIRGTGANELADHRLANLLDCLSVQNPFGFEYYGYVDQGYTWNPDSPVDRLNGPVEVNYRSNDYQLNGLYLVGERKINPDLRRVQLGVRSDLLYGTDALLGGSSLGLDDNFSSGRFYGLALPQLYANVYLPLGNGISCKVGKFYTPIGNEGLIATDNFFYSNYLGWNITPTTHTGVLVEGQLSETVQFQFGPNLGWNNSENTNHAASFLTGVQWTARDQRQRLNFAMQTGRQQGVISSGDANVTVYSLIFNHTINEKWHYLVEHDLLVSQSRIGSPDDDFESYSLANYLFYDISRDWRAGLRFEWLRDDDGTLVGFDPARPAAPGSFYNLTFGLNWHPRDHLRIRPEIRSDWQHRDSNAVPPAFNDNTSTTQWLISCDILWEF